MSKYDAFNSSQPASPGLDVTPWTAIRNGNDEMDGHVKHKDEMNGFNCVISLNGTDD